MLILDTSAEHNATLCVQVVVFPQRPQLVFSTHVPDGELQVLVFHRLHVETFRDLKRDLIRGPRTSGVFLPVQARRSHRWSGSAA